MEIVEVADIVTEFVLTENDVPDILKMAALLVGSLTKIDPAVPLDDVPLHDPATG